MNHTQHFHPANLQFLLAEARHEAKEFSPRPAHLPRQPKFTRPDCPTYRFLLTAELATERLALVLRAIGKRPGELLGFGENPSGTPVAVVRRLSHARRQFVWQEV